jgi:hypothetical protein
MQSKTDQRSFGARTQSISWDTTSDIDNKKWQREQGQTHIMVQKSNLKVGTSGK